MKNSIRRLLLAAAIATTGLSSIAYADGGSISIAVAENPQQLDPMRSANAPDILLHGQIFARLLHRDSAGKISAGLAESWTISQDGLTYTFKLRDAKFSNGSAITAEDVVFSLDRTLNDKESAYPAPLAAIASLKADDARTVTITLKGANAPFFENLEVFNASIVSKADVMARGNEAFNPPVSSGAFIVKDWAVNDRLTLVRNPNYYRAGLPKLDKVEYRIVEDSNTRVSMIKAGQVDVIEAVPYANIAELKAGGNITVPLEASTKTQIILLNHAVAPFDDMRVRQAAVMALDRAAIAKAVTLGLVTHVANSTLPGALTYHYEDDSIFPYDVAAAKALINAAGATGAKVQILQISGNQVSQQVSQIAQALWSQIGLDVEIIQLDNAAYRARRKTPDWNAVPAWYYNETLDPDLAVRWAICGSCGSNSFFTKYNNEEVNALTEAALVEGDTKKRAELYKRIQQISTKEVTHIPLFYPPFTNAYGPKVKGLFMTPAFQWTLEEAERVE